MVFDGFLLISFYFFVFILPGTGIIFGIIELKNRTSNKNAVSKKKNNRFGIYGIVSILFIIFLLFFPIHTVLSLKYSKPESLLKYFEKTLIILKNTVLVICHIPQEYHGAVLEKKELPMKNMMDT